MKRVARNKGLKGMFVSGMKGKKHTVDSLKKMSEAHKGCVARNKGKQTPANIIEKLRKSHLGQKARNKGKKLIGKHPMLGKHHTEEAKEKNRKAHIGLYVGEKGSNRQGGITPENHKIRTSMDMTLRKKACFSRDQFTCQKCKISGGYLHCHHINNFADYPELRTSIVNGITLCKICHHRFHKIYGRRNNTIQQIEEYITAA